MNLDDLRDFYDREARGEPVDPEIAGSINALRQGGEAPPQGYQWSPKFNPDGTVVARPLRNNNPLNIKVKTAPGMVGQDPAEDGGAFAIFASPEHGFAAAANLLATERYTKLDLEGAMRRWSNKEYGADAVRDLGLDPTTPMASLDAKTRAILMMHMAKKEGYPLDKIDTAKASALMEGFGAPPPAPGAPPAPAPSPASPAAAPPAAPAEDTTDPFMGTMASILGRMGEGGSALMQAAAPQKGEDPGVLATLQRTPRMLTLGNLGNLAQAAGPLALGPASAAGELAGGVLARTLGPYSPVSPETAQMVGSFGPLGLGLAQGTARLTSPALRRLAREEAHVAGQQAAHASQIAGAQEALHQAGTANMGALMAQAGQLAEQPAAGQLVHDVAGSIAARLQREADELFHRSYETTRGRPRELIRPGSLEKVEPGTLPSSPAPREPIPGTPPTTRVEGPFPPGTETGKPGYRVTLGPGTPPTPGKILTEKDYRAGFMGMRRDHERAAQTAMDFDRHISRRLARLEGQHARTSQVLARDPDLLRGLLAHANPIEATLLERAVRTGQKLSDLPFNKAQMDALERATLEPFLPGALPGSEQTPSLARNILSYVIPGRAGRAGLGALFGTAAYYGTLSNPAVATAAGTYYVSRLALKAIDAALGTRRGQQLFRALPGLAPGSPEAMGVWATLGDRLAGDGQDDED